VVACGVAGEVSPDGMQRLLNFSPWDEDACRDALARYVVRNLGDLAAVLAVDETRGGRVGLSGSPSTSKYSGTNPAAKPPSSPRSPTPPSRPYPPSSTPAETDTMTLPKTSQAATPLWRTCSKPYRVPDRPNNPDQPR
jgi:hypothetical protein